MKVTTETKLRFLEQLAALLNKYDVDMSAEIIYDDTIHEDIPNLSICFADCSEHSFNYNEVNTFIVAKLSNTLREPLNG